MLVNQRVSSSTLAVEPDAGGMLQTKERHELSGYTRQSGLQRKDIFLGKKPQDNDLEF